jgi:hypothetical protein
MVKKTKSDEIKVNAEDLRAVGPEPTWTPDEPVTSIALSSAYNWYNYILEDKDRQKIVAEFVSGADARAIMACESWRISNLVAAQIRMEKRGYVLSSEQLARRDATIASWVEIGNAKLNVPKKAPVAMKVIPVTHVADLEEHLDEYFLSGMKKPWDVAVLHTIKAWNPTKESLQGILEHYSDQLVEAQAAVKGQIDGYEKYKPGQLKNWRDAIEEIVESAKALMAETSVSKAQKKPRKPRAKKPVDPKKATSKFKFMQEHAELGLTSQPIKSIIGSKEVWLYNSQKRILQHYVANTEAGLMVKGTSVMDFNGDLSAGRKIRKPETLGTLMAGGYKTVTKAFDALKVKPTEVTGRSNEFTLVLKVVK